MNNRLLFPAGIAVLTALMVVFSVQMLESSCLCDGLPGGQCTPCDNTPHALTNMDALSARPMRDPEHLQRFLEAWENEHQLRHRAWQEQHQELHRQGLLTNEDGHRDYHREMEGAHRDFHAVFDARLRVFLSNQAQP